MVTIQNVDVHFDVEGDEDENRQDQEPGFLIDCLVHDAQPTSQPSR